IDTILTDDNRDARHSQSCERSSPPSTGALPQDEVSAWQGARPLDTGAQGSRLGDGRASRKDGMTSRDMTPSIDLTSHLGTGPVRSRRPVYVDLLPPCNAA